MVISTQKEVLKLCANCIPVKGAAKSIICDLQRHSYLYIPNDLYNILTVQTGKSVAEIKAVYDNLYDSVIDNYFEVLAGHDLIYFTDTPELFPELDTQWEEPFEITNAIIDLDESSVYNLRSVLAQLSELHCKFVQIRFYRSALIAELADILLFLNTINSNSIGIDLIVPYNKTEISADYISLFTRFKRLNFLLAYACPIQEEKVHQLEPSRYFICTKDPVYSEKHCGVIDKRFFSVNIKTYTEGLQHNTCLNGKLSIDRQGQIKNCPSMLRSFGNVSEIKMADAMKSHLFKAQWNITKNAVNICKDCEFRYICTDCRAYLEDPEDELSKPLKCGYDPYTNVWSEWGNSELKHKARTYYSL